MADAGAAAAAAAAARVKVRLHAMKNTPGIFPENSSWKIFITNQRSCSTLVYNSDTFLDAAGHGAELVCVVCVCV